VKKKPLLGKRRRGEFSREKEKACLEERKDIEKGGRISDRGRKPPCIVLKKADSFTGEKERRLECAEGGEGALPALSEGRRLLPRI